MERGRRQFEAGGSRWRAVEAWRSSKGSSLVYFLPLAAGSDRPAEDDRRDRRAGLEPGRRLAELPAAELEGLLEGGTGLTGTERRFRAPDGRPWLAQSVGPVWAEGGVAEGLTGVLFTSLAGEVRRVRGSGAHVGEADEERLADWWRDAVGGEAGGDRGPDDGASAG